MKITVGVLALQGAFIEHISLLEKSADVIARIEREGADQTSFNFLEVRNEHHLSQCDALIIPGGESTAISFVAAQSGLLEPLRDFVKLRRKPTWGTCAGLILLAESANRTKKGGQDLIGGLDVRVNRNHFGRQVESFQAGLSLPFLVETSDLAGLSHRPFPGVFIRAPIVEKILPNVDGVQREEEKIDGTIVAPSRKVKDAEAKKAMAREVKIMGMLPGRLTKSSSEDMSSTTNEEAGHIIAVQQGNVFGTSFHPELTADIRIHLWWLIGLMGRQKATLP